METDADGVSDLFRVVYGDCYVYPDVYLPTMIRRHNALQRWHSAVAVMGEQIVGHAVLWRHADTPDQAEFALNVVHPMARGNGIATHLARHLCDYAREQGLSMLTIKQVSSHGQSQRLANTLGFHTTALMLDYVDSPFGNDWRESIVLGCLPLQPHPIPALDWPNHWRDWVSPITRYFGSCPAPADTPTTLPLTIASREHRIEVTLHDLHPAHVDEVAKLPTERLIYLKLALTLDTPIALQQLEQAGYRCAGLVPGPQQHWFALLLRGYHAHELELRCPIAMALYQCHGHFEPRREVA
nr:GNAT family N-acetyltransferase [Chitinivorax sp. B]